MDLIILKRYVLNIFLLVYITNSYLVFGLILKLKARRKHHLSRYRCKYTNFNLKNIKLVSLMYILDILVTRVCYKVKDIYKLKSPSLSYKEMNLVWDPNGGTLMSHQVIVGGLLVAMVDCFIDNWLQRIDFQP